MFVAKDWEKDLKNVPTQTHFHTVETLIHLQKFDSSSAGVHLRSSGLYSSALRWAGGLVTRLGW